MVIIPKTYFKMDIYFIYLILCEVFIVLNKELRWMGKRGKEL